jgi:7,8-dihydroneopterin aldolase/epimerase/oxygenase
MKELTTIEVKDMRIYAGHGVHSEEALAGNEFLVSVSVSFEPEGKISSLSETVDYVKLSEIIKKEMKERKKLLETLAQNITEATRSAFGNIKKISVNIQKLAPPIANFTGTVGVSYTSN